MIASAGLGLRACPPSWHETPSRSSWSVPHGTVFNFGGTCSRAETGSEHREGEYQWQRHPDFQWHSGDKVTVRVRFPHAPPRRDIPNALPYFYAKYTDENDVTHDLTRPVEAGTYRDANDVVRHGTNPDGDEGPQRIRLQSDTRHMQETVGDAVESSARNVGEPIRSTDLEGSRMRFTLEGADDLPRRGEGAGPSRRRGHASGGHRGDERGGAAAGPRGAFGGGGGGGSGGGRRSMARGTRTGDIRPRYLVSRCEVTESVIRIVVRAVESLDGAVRNTSPEPYQAPQLK